MHRNPVKGAVVGTSAEPVTHPPFLSPQPHTVMYMVKGDKSGEGADRYDSHILRTGHQASQDFDAWVLKLGAAGFTLVLGVAALVKTESFAILVVSGFLFAGSLMTGLLSLRLSADGLREQAENPNADIKQFGWVTRLNWLVFVTLSVAFLMLAVFVGVDAIPKE